MGLKNILMMLGSDPIPISSREKALVALASFGAVVITALLAHNLMHSGMPYLLASMGASAAILFVMPGSPVAQPWPLVGGHLCSAWIGISIPYLIPDTGTAAATATGLSILAMLLLRCFHPPGAATALAPILNHPPARFFDLNYIIIPVGINVILMLALAIMINRYILKRRYPLSNQDFLAKKTKSSRPQNKLNDFYKEDIQQAIHDFDNFLDISYDDLGQLFTQIQLNSFKRHQTPITCASIMRRDIMTLSYDTEVEWAWNVMEQHQLKAMPVLDKARRVIGIVTKYDFFKYVKLTPYANFQEKFLAFIQKTPDIQTHKPEAIGHIMSRKVAALPDSAPIADILQLVVNEGHRHIPIVDNEQRFVGMIFQRDFVAALFHSKTTETVG